MAREQFSLQTKSRWMSGSGNALVALVNNAGSGKNITIHSIEVYNNTRIGQINGANNTNTPASNRIRVDRVSALGTGPELTPVKADNNANSWPTSVKLYTDCSYTPNYIQVGAAHTNTTIAAGGLTYTPAVTPSAPVWGVNEHHYAGRWFYCSSGTNQGYYKIISNTTTALTFETPFPATASTPGYIVQPHSIAQDSFTKFLRTDATTAIPVIGFGNLNGKKQATGGMGLSSENGDIQNITIRDGEKLAVFCDVINSNFPMSVSIQLNVDGNTYLLDFYALLECENSAIFGIDNQSGSGKTVTVSKIQITELGTQDTPYIQVVPIGSLDPGTLSDPARKITDKIIKHDSAFSTPNSSIMDVFLDSPILPFGVPPAYISEGSALATPKGFSYINTKDFIGPVYATYFPEAMGFKTALTTTVSMHTTTTPGTLGTQISQKYSNLKGQNAPIVIREGEGIAIVSGAETAAGVNIVGASGWEAFDFNFVFSIDNAVIPYLTLTGLIANTEVRVYDAANNDIEIAGVEDSNTTFTTTYDYSTTPYVDIVIHSLGYEYIRLANVALTSTGLTIPIQQRVDRNYAS